MDVQPPLPENVLHWPDSPWLFFNTGTIFSTWFVMILLVVLFWYLARRPKMVPGRGQAFVEMIVDAFRNMVNEALGPKLGPRYVVYFGCLFLFVWFSNLIGLLPTYWIDVTEFKIGTFHFHPIEEPTKDYNTPGILALISLVFIAHLSEIRVKGIGGYFKGYLDPFGFPAGLIMMPLNVVGRAAEFISISFRLFGNIYGGAVIMIVVSGLLFHLVLPPFMMGFFGLFVGTVQAFVFTMLALTYTAIGVTEED